MRGPLPLVLWMKSGPSFTGGACKLSVRCRSSSARPGREGGIESPVNEGGAGGRSSGRGHGAQGLSKCEQLAVDVVMGLKGAANINSRW